MIYIYVYIVSLCIQCVIVLYYIKLHHIIVVDLIQHVLYYVVPVNIISYWFILYVYIYNIILYHSRLYHVTYHIPYHRLYYVCTFLKAPAIGGKILLHIKSPNVIFSPEVCKCRWRLLCHGSFLNYLVEFSELRHLLWRCCMFGSMEHPSHLWTVGWCFFWITLCIFFAARGELTIQQSTTQQYELWGTSSVRSIQATTLPSEWITSSASMNI